MITKEYDSKRSTISTSKRITNEDPLLWLQFVSLKVGT